MVGGISSNAGLLGNRAVVVGLGRRLGGQGEWIDSVSLVWSIADVLERLEQGEVLGNAESVHP